MGPLLVLDASSSTPSHWLPPLLGTTLSRYVPCPLLFLGHAIYPTPSTLTLSRDPYRHSTLFVEQLLLRIDRTSPVEEYKLDLDLSKILDRARCEILLFVEFSKVCVRIVC